jgi:DNA-binding response OmpR family regulator
VPLILIVDDDEAMRGLIKDYLSGTYDVIDTGSSEIALAMTIQSKPDAILLDLSMPGVSGFELCQVLTSLSFTHQIPVFIVTGEDERNKVFCQHLGACGYFTKPIDFAKLKRDLAAALGSKKAEQRADVRVQLRVTLKLKGKDRSGAQFETRATAENLSNGGFLCAGASSLEEATAVEVFLCGEREHCLGYARLVRVVKGDANALSPRYGFQFTGTNEPKTSNSP